MALAVKNLTLKAGDAKDMDSIPGTGRSPGGEPGSPLHYFLPGESHGWRKSDGLQSIGLQGVRHN